MTATIENAFVQTYETNVRHLAQQSPTRLRPYVMERGLNSEKHNWERIGSNEVNQKTTRLQVTPDDTYAFSRRVSVPKTYDTGSSTEQEEIVQMIIDPNSAYAHAHAMAMRRGFDDEIISAATGDALDGAGNPVVFPNSQKVFGNTVDVYDTPINFDLITQVTERFLENDIDPSEPKVFVIGPTQARKLLQLTEASNADYNSLRPLQSRGIVDYWMGYSWLVSTRLLHPTAPGTDIQCFAMTKRALGLMVDRDITSRIAEDPSFSFVWRLYSYMTIGAVRVEDEHIVQLQVADTI